MVWNYQTNSVQRRQLTERTREVFFSSEPEFAFLFQTGYNELDIAVAGRSRLLRHELGDIETVTFTPDGKEALVVQRVKNEGLLSRIGLYEETPAVEFRHPSPVRTTAFSPDGTLLLTTGIDGLARVWLRDGTLKTQFEGIFQNALFSPNGRQVLLIPAEGELQLHDLPSTFPDWVPLRRSC